MRYLGGAPLELRLLADLGIILFLFFSSASATTFIILFWSMAALANSFYDKLEMHQALLQMDGVPYTVQADLLFIRVDVV
jgi:hypothetical protein